jgi:2,4-dienoyl-CoA reductase-like NADH-dependent reductase (Old Yellow Enzyme family)
MRKVLPREFAIGLKVNSGDYVSSSIPSNVQAEKRALEHILEISRWRGVDFIEVSGGDYESPGKSFSKDVLDVSLNWAAPLDFMTAEKSSSGSRQVLFSKVSREVVTAIREQAYSSETAPLVLLTGGFTRYTMPSP